MTCGLLERPPDYYCLPVSLAHDATWKPRATGHVVAHVVAHVGVPIAPCTEIANGYADTPILRIGLASLSWAIMTPAASGAQAPRSAPSSATSTPALRALRAADALVQRGDTGAAVALLDSALTRERKDAGLWHRYAELVWSDRSRTVRSFEDAKVIAVWVRCAYVSQHSARVLIRWM